MCNHKNKELNLAEKEYSVESKCEIENLVNKLNSNLSEEEKITFQMDENGLCIFHSPNLEWKTQNNCNETLKDIIYKCCRLKKPELSDINFREIITTNVKIEISKLQMGNVSIDFSGSQINSPLIIRSCTSEKDIDFTTCRFAKSVDISSSTFYGIRWNLSHFTQTLNINQSNFTNHCIFDTAIFTHNFNINRCTFEGSLGFKNVDVYSLDYELGSQFIDVRFQDANFTESEFDCQLIMQDVFTHGDLDFTDVTFCEKATTSFSNINLNGNWYLKSTNNENKIFKNTCYFSIRSEKINGTIHFQNADVRYIPTKQLDHLMSMEKEGKVIFGEGCLKYRVQTPNKRIEIQRENQNLILEFVLTFTRFFNFHQGKNLGVEIVNQSESELEFFYYSNQIIDQQEFNELLSFTEQNFWSLGTEMNSPNNALNSLVYDEAEILVSKISILMKLQLKNNSWLEKDTKALMSSISNKKEIVNSDELHLSFKSSQNTGRTILFVNNFLNSAPIYNSNLLINRIEEFNDYSNYNFPVTEIEKFKSSLIDTIEKEGDIFVKEVEKLIKTQSKPTLKDFLTDFHVAIGQNLSAAMIFEVMKKIFLL